MKHLIYLPIELLSHKSKIDSIFKVVFSRQILEPSYFCKDSKEFELLENPEMIFKEEFQNFAINELLKNKVA